MNAFALDERLAADSVFVADGPLSQLRLMDDARFPWLVLVPRVAGAVEWFDLGPADQSLLWNEVRHASALLRGDPRCGKLNLGALGNIVRQLHVHVVARHPGDAAWPGPVWGSGAAQRHAPEALAAELAKYREAWAARG
jgi:diadenosine tetraphosphate (Ap4A) HIT family hydrolase